MNADFDLFSLAEARRLRDEGMQRVAAHSPRWSDLAFAAIERVARRQVHVHVDDVLAEGVPQPHHFNAWGATWMRAIRAGLIQRTNQTRPSKDPLKRAHNMPVYFSMIYDHTGARR